MIRDDGAPERENRFTHFFDWVDGKLTPAFGPPARIPYGADDKDLSAAACPLCGEAMGAHEIDHTTANAVLECPITDRVLLKSESGPLDEFGMPASAARLQKLAARHH